MNRRLLTLSCVLILSPVYGCSATPGLPFTEDFSSDTLIDASKKNADLKTGEQKVRLPFTDVDGIVISNDDAAYTEVLGDMVGDGAQYKSAKKMKCFQGYWISSVEENTIFNLEKYNE